VRGANGYELKSPEFSRKFHGYKPVRFHLKLALRQCVVRPLAAPRAESELVNLIRPDRSRSVNADRATRAADRRSTDVLITSRRHWSSILPVQRTAVKQRPHQETERCQVATSEPVDTSPRARREDGHDARGVCLQRLVGRRAVSPVRRARAPHRWRAPIQRARCQLRRESCCRGRS
jgi:hypothetical protein